MPSIQLMVYSAGIRLIRDLAVDYVDKVTRASRGWTFAPLLQRMSKCTKSCFFLSSDNTDIGDDPRRSRSLGDEPRVGGFEKKCTAF